MSHDEEVLQQVKTWWQRYGTGLLLAVAVAVASFAGVRWWNQDRLQSAESAQVLLEQMATQAQRLRTTPDDTAAAGDLQRIGRQLMDEFPRTPHAIDGALLLAAHSVHSDDLASAETQLRWALARKPAAETRVLVEVRLARVLAAADKVDDGLALLDRDASVPGLAAMIEEARGDLLLLKGQTAEAAKAYQAADAALAARNEDNPVLALKLADLGLAPEPRKEEAE